MRNQLPWAAALIFIIVACSSKPSIQKKITSTYPDGALKTVDLIKIMDGQETIIGDELYYSNGQLKRKREKKDGYPNGLWIEYYKSGQKKVEKRYLNGNLEGVQRGWYTDGAKFYEAHFQNGTLLNRTEWNPDGSKRN